MDAEQAETRSKPLGFSAQAVHVFVLLCLAFAARLYDVLGRQPMFFVARGSRLVDVLLFVLILSAVLPGLVVLLEWLAGLRSRRIGRGCHAVVVLLSATAIVLAGLKQIEWPGSSSAVSLAFSAGALATVAYLRSAAARAAVTILCPAVVLFPGLFLCGLLDRTLLFRAAGPPALEVQVGKPAPVVMVVFDEFCGTSLMDGRRRIDPVRYPNFAALAEDGTWFRNATTTSPHTPSAIASLLTGRYPTESLVLPTASEYPQNLFTLLGNSHELVAWEAETYLCPARLYRRDSQGTGLAARLRSLLIDASVLELHILFFEDGPFSLPDVTGRWGNFLGQEESFGGRPDAYFRRRERSRDFVRRIQPSAKPHLYFAHLVLPHAPWSYLPSGKEYSAPLAPGTSTSPDVTYDVIGLHRRSEQWLGDELAVVQAYQRYLLQVGFVDRLLGELVDHLKQVGLYDRSLLVITADHGVSFHPKRNRRELDDMNYPDIMSIPLLIKLPNQRQGAVSDRNVQSVDVLPSIADALEIELPWKPDGISIWDGSQPEPAHKQIVAEEGSSDRLTLPGAFPEKEWTLRRMLATFGSGGESDRLFRVGPFQEIVGRRVEEFRVKQAGGGKIELVGPERFADVDLDSARLPCYIGGRVHPPAGVSLPLPLAIALHGRIRAVSRTFQIKRLEDTWAAMVSEEAFGEGRNEVRVFTVSSADGEITLHTTTPATFPADR